MIRLLSGIAPMQTYKKASMATFTRRYGALFLAASLLLSTGVYSQGDDTGSSGVGDWDVFFDNEPTNLTFYLKRYFGSPYSYPLSPRYWGGLLSFVPQPGAGVRWVKVKQTEVPLIPVPFHPGYIGGTPVVSGKLIRLVPPTSSAISVPAAGIGSLASNMWWTAEWTDRFVTIVSDELEDGERRVIIDLPNQTSILKVLRGNFRKGGDNEPVLNVRDMDGNMTVDSAMTFVPGHHEQIENGVNWVDPYFQAGTELEAVAPAWRAKENPFTGAPISVNWSPAGAWLQKWHKPSPGAIVPAPISIFPPQPPTLTQSVTVTDQSSDPDSLGSGTATYTMRWHYPGENWAALGPNYLVGAQLSDWHIKSSAAPPQPVITTQKPLVINYGAGKPWIIYGGNAFSVAAIIAGAAARYYPGFTIPAAIFTLISTVAGWIGPPQGTDSTIYWVDVEDLPPGYLQMQSEERLLHPLFVSIKPEELRRDDKGDGYDSDGYKGSLPQ